MRQALLSAVLASTWVMVVVVSVRHHPSDQVGHRVFNFADHLRHPDQKEKKKERKIQRNKMTRDAISRRKTTAREDGDGNHFRKRLFSSLDPCDSFQKKQTRGFPHSNRIKSLLSLRMGRDPAGGCGSSDRAGLHWDVQPAVKNSQAPKYLDNKSLNFFWYYIWYLSLFLLHKSPTGQDKGRSGWHRQEYISVTFWFVVM